MVDKIRGEIKKEISDLKCVDTIYLLINIVTPQMKEIIQSAEYRWAATEAKRSRSSESTTFDNKANEFMYKANAADTSLFLFYVAAPLIIYTKNNLEKGMAEKRMYFDKDFNLIPKYSFITRISKTDNGQIRINPYEPFSQEDYENFDKSKILKYY